VLVLPYQPIARTMSNLDTSLKSGTSLPLPEHSRDFHLDVAPDRAYTSTSRLSLGCAPAVNDIVSFGDEIGHEKVTT